jgi:riboflavin transporter FmnP
MSTENHPPETQEIPAGIVAVPPPEHRHNIRRKRLEEELHEAEQRHNAFLSSRLPLVVVLLALEGALAEVIFGHPTVSDVLSRINSPLFVLALGHPMEGLISWPWSMIVSTVLRIVPFWLLTLAIVVPLYYFRVRERLRRAREDLKNHEEQVQRERRSTPVGLLGYLQEKARRLCHETARVFLDNPKGYEKAKKWRKNAEHILDQAAQHGPQAANLGEAQFLITSIYECIVREEGELRAQRKWRYIVIGIIFVYIAGLVGIALANAGRSNEPVPVFGVPLSVAMWGAAGSLAAILYRFYNQEERVRLDFEVRWLIARPVIGIIMGAVVYLAMKAGLFLLTATPQSDTGPAAPASQLGVYWLIAFIAGFSDKFYIKIINLLVEGAVGLRG